MIGSPGTPQPSNPRGFAPEPYRPSAAALPPDLRAEMAAVRRRLDELMRPPPAARASPAARAPDRAPSGANAAPLAPPPPPQPAVAERRRLPRADITIAPGWGDRPDRG